MHLTSFEEWGSPEAGLLTEIRLDNRRQVRWHKAGSEAKLLNMTISNLLQALVGGAPNCLLKFSMPNN